MKRGGPPPVMACDGVYFQDWGQNPFGGGYHGWSAHYDICSASPSNSRPWTWLCPQRLKLSGC